MYAIEVSKVSKKFRERGKNFYALRNVSLNVEQGEILGILGPNGAGKTTLLNIIVGIVEPDSGRVKILGKTCDSSVLASMNFVSGESRFHFSLRVRDVLDVYARIYGLTPQEKSERVKDLVEKFGLKRVYNRKYGYLSTGEKVRVAFAKALLNKPKIILFDEPTLGLDPEIAIRVRKEIKSLNKKHGVTIILTSHYMNEVEQLSDRIAFISDGEIVDIGSVESVKLSKFSTYDVVITVDRIKYRAFLDKNKFAIDGHRLHMTLSHGEDISRILALLNDKGFKILDIQTKKPTLEDYFVKILGDKKGDKE
jgi:ABC-2 type transport system ATP-binding protein